MYLWALFIEPIQNIEIMSLPTVFNFLKSKFFWINVGVAILSVIVLTIIVLFSLKFFTKHGEQVAVPDVTGLTVKRLTFCLKSKIYRTKLLTQCMFAINCKEKFLNKYHVPKLM